MGAHNVSTGQADCEALLVKHPCAYLALSYEDFFRLILATSTVVRSNFSVNYYASFQTLIKRPMIANYRYQVTKIR